DGERVFGYRALRFSRGDTTPLPGFDEEAFVARSTFDASTLADLVGEFGHQRQANLHFFRRLTPEQWTRRGTANQTSMSLRAIASALVGHVRHHLDVLGARYL